LALRALRGAAFVYVALLIVLLLLENTLLYPAPRYPDPRGDWEATYLPHEDVEFTSADGTRLHGWLVEHPKPNGALVYFHGNGDCIGFLGPFLKDLRDKHQLTVFAFDYRGYGKSGGSVSEAGIVADGDAAQRWLAERIGRRPSDVILMGRSLGGCVAVDLAAKNGARALILQNTPTSMPDAAANIYWFLPVKWLMRNRYDSLSKIGRYDGPLLQSHGTADELVPYSLGQQLFAAAPCQAKQFFPIDGGTHNDEEPAEYYAALDKFLSALPPQNP
jgi:fermentation-respiration switch protein FrsA (DUF1100 family)